MDGLLQVNSMGPSHLNDRQREPLGTIRSLSLSRLVSLSRLSLVSLVCLVSLICPFCLSSLSFLPLLCPCLLFLLCLPVSVSPSFLSQPQQYTHGERGEPAAEGICGDEWAAWE